MTADEAVAGVKDGMTIMVGGYPAHTAVETAYYKELAASLNLCVTGGSDTHFSGGNRTVGAPVFYADDALAEKLKIEI